MLLKKLSCFVAFSVVFCDKDIHEFFNLSEELQANFDNFEIVSRQELKSDWCKVNYEIFKSLDNISIFRMSWRWKKLEM